MVAALSAWRGRIGGRIGHLRRLKSVRQIAVGSSPYEISDEGKFCTVRILVIDVGGSKVKFNLWGRRNVMAFPSGPKLTASRVVKQILTVTYGWNYDVVSIGFPGVIGHGKIVHASSNLGSGWVGFDFQKHFPKPVKIINDAVMQALGSYRGGRMLFLGLGTGLGSALILDDVVVPLALGDLVYSKKRTLGEILGKDGLNHLGRNEWEETVHRAVESLGAAFGIDYVVIGGGNVKHLKKLPSRARRGHNDNAFIGGARLWGLAGAHAKPGKEHIWIIK